MSLKHLLLILFLLPLCSLATSEIPEFKKNPVVYGVSPYYLSQGQPLKALVHLESRLAEIKDLGANIVWLQPITPPYEPGHGYDVMDFRQIWSELGTPQDLKNLVLKAHALNLKLMLDIVINHSSSHHPFVQDILTHGKNSSYYDFYQHKNPMAVPYSQYFQNVKINSEIFMTYFWPHLLNFNFESSNFRNYIFDTLEYWVNEYDIDGYRFDASWAPSSRWPSFYKTVSARLRSLKPNIILMAEDQAGYPIAYKNAKHPHLRNSGFDWAYDWNNEDPYWISKWSFQVGDGFESTVFNMDDPSESATQFIQSLRYGKGTSDIKTLRYLENNDTPGLMRHHSLEQAKWAAKITFTLPGVPLIFYGQEVGNGHEIYNLPSFKPGQPIADSNPKLWFFYKQLIHRRRNSRPLSEGTLENLTKISEFKVRYDRRYLNEVIKVELDFKDKVVKLNGHSL